MGENRERGREEEEEKKSKQGPRSEEQREKLIKQKEQYEKAAEKLEDQLLKMKENAKLQKEVKYRITYMKEYMEKIEKGLAEDARAAQDQKEKDRERAWREQEQARLQLNRVEKNGGSSRDSSEEK